SVSALKHHKDEVQTVKTGMECGLSMDGDIDFRAGDVIVCFEELEVPQVVTLLLVLRVSELVFWLGQFPLQPLQTPLLLLCFTLRLLLQPHPKGRGQSNPLRSGRSLLFLMVDISEAPSTQVSAGLSVGGLLNLSSKSSEHGAKTWKTDRNMNSHTSTNQGAVHFLELTSLPSTEPGFQVIDCSILQPVLQLAQMTVGGDIEVLLGSTRIRTYSN
ncbi:hypothetical protein GOODEAATRI_025608, partial [Goodea atripinnis]